MKRAIEAIRIEFMEENIIFYDGDCIYCQKYVEFTQIRLNLGSVALKDLRQFPNLVQALRATGIEANQGMIFIEDDRLYWGSDAVNRLSVLSKPKRKLDNIILRTLRSEKRSRALYPFMKLARRATLAVRNRGLIE